MVKNVCVTLDETLKERFDSECSHVTNFSAWVCDKMKDELAVVRMLIACPCGVQGSRAAWDRWFGICPNCKHDHRAEDTRKRIPSIKVGSL